MSDPTPPPAAPAPGIPVTGLSETAVFTALLNAQRRHLLKRLALASGGLTAGAAGEGHKLQRNLMVKHLTFLRDLGLLTAAPHAGDGRSLCYQLSPLIARRTTGTMRELDFGCGVLRWTAGEEQSPFPRPLVRHRRRRF